MSTLENRIAFMPGMAHWLRACAALTLCACAPQLPELNVERQWAQAIERQSMWAFFPLDEDVMVGDVFVQFRDERLGELPDGFNIVRIARTPALDVVQGLCESSAERVPVSDPPPKTGQPAASATTPAAPATTPAATTTPAAASPSPAAAAAAPVAPAGTPDCARVATEWAKRLPGGPGALPAGLVLGDASGTGGLRRGLVALPNATVARLTQAQIDGSGLMGNFAGNVGLGGGGTVALSIDLKDLQQLQIENDVAWGMLIALVRGDSAARPLSILRLLAQRAPAELARVCRGGEPRRGSAQVSIATRVLYAGGVTYNFAQSNQFVARLALDATAAIIPNQRQPNQTPGLGTSGAVAGAPANLEALRAQLEALSGALAGGPVGSAAGGSARLVIGSLGSSALSATFARPLAVGAGSRLVFPVEDALLPRSADEVGQVMRYCWQVARTMQGVEHDPDAPPQWCAVGDGRHAWPAGWTGGSDALYARLCNFVARRPTLTAALGGSGARSFRQLGGEPLHNYFRPGRTPFTGVARGS